MSAIPATLLPIVGLDLTGFPAFDEYRERSIGGIVAQVTIDEDHEDEMVITEHPVEYNANISDHAFKRAAEVRVRVGWSQSGVWIRPMAGTPSDLTQQAQNVQDVREFYEGLLGLQQQRQPFVVYTGKRVYQNMLVAGIRVHTDRTSEYTLLAEVRLREVILVHTQTVPGGVPNNQSQLGSPPTNMPQSQNGSIQPVPVSLTPAQYGGTEFGPLP